MANIEGINDQLAIINIEDEENEELVFGDDAVEESNKFDMCLVGRFLTEKGINGRAMKSKMGDVWRPARGQHKRFETRTLFVPVLSYR